MGVLTSSRRYLWRRHLDSKSAAPEMTSTKTWDGLFDPYCGGGGKWRPFRFRPPSWMTSFAEPEIRSSKMATGSGRAAIFHRRRNRDRIGHPILLAVQGIFIIKITRSWDRLILKMGIPILIRWNLDIETHRPHPEPLIINRLLSKCMVTTCYRSSM